MGVFDIFSEDAQRFNWLLENYPEETSEVYRALVQCGAINSVGYGRYDPTPDVPLRFKKILVAHESDIKQIHFFVEQDRRKQVVIDHATRFPHAYLFFCKKEGIPENNITELSPKPTMPGNWVFNTFAPHNHKTLFDHDDHFQQMVTEELARFGYVPYIPRPVSTTPDTVSKLSSIPSFYGGLSLSKSLFPKKDASQNPNLLFGFARQNASGRISVDPYKHTIEVKEFIENKDLDAIYKHLSEFPAKEKSLSCLLEREKKWHIFEDKVLGHEFGCQYYRLYFMTQFGTDQVGLDKYEALGADPTVLNSVIQKGEKAIKDIIKENPYGFEEFKKTHPGIPRYEYYKHRAVIEKLERKSRYAKYDVNQTDLSSAVVSGISANTSWTIEQQDIPCRLESYEGRMSRGHCKMVHVFKKMVYHDALDDAAPYLELYPHCTDIIRNSGIFNGDTSETAFQEEVFESFTEILIPIIDSYLTVFRTNCITVVLSEEAWAFICPKEHLEGSDLYASLESTKGLYQRIIKKKPSFSNLLSVIPSSLFDVEHYTPYIFVDLFTSSEQVSRHFQENADLYCLSSSVSFIKIIDEQEIKAIEASRKKNEEDHQLKEIQDIKRSYPWGFQYFCSRYGIKESDYLLRYSLIMNARDEIRQAQRNEEDRQKEVARRQYETKIINQAVRLIADYPNAAKESGFHSASSIDYSTAQQILSKESAWRNCEILYYKRFELFGESKSVSGLLPHKFFLDYYPSKRYDDKDLTKEQVSDRSFIWGFKDGKDYYQERAVEMVSDYINNTRLKPYLNKIVFVCSPASNSISNSTRFQYFSREVCNRTGMIDGFGHIHLTGFTTPKRMGGHGCVEFDADRSFFVDSFVILFDDIVTSGGTISTTKSRLEQVGARVIGVVSLGKTV